MVKIFFRHKVDSLFCLNTREQHSKSEIGAWKFSLPNKELLIYEDLASVNGLQMFSGLKLDCYISGTDADVCKILSFSLTSIILNLLSFSCLATWRNSRLEMEYNASEGIEAREAKSFFYPGESTTIPTLKAIRIVEKDLFSKVFSAFFAKEESVQIMINKAIYQLNSGFINMNYDDKFINYWTGLSYLSSSLNEKFCIKDKETLPNCPSCQTVFASCPSCSENFKKIKVKSNFEGVKKVANATNITKSDFDEFYKIRSVLLKNGNKRSIAGYVNKLPKLRKLLIACICELLQLPPPIVQILLNKDPLETDFSSPENQIIHVATINGLSTIPKIEDFHSQPFVNLSFQNPKPTLLNNGLINIQGNITFHYTCSENISFTISEVQQYVPSSIPGLSS